MLAHRPACIAGSARTQRLQSMMAAGVHLRGRSGQAVKCRASTLAPGSTLPHMNTSPSPASWHLSVLGDLHLEPKQMGLFHAAQGHLRTAMRDEATGEVSANARVVQLGDLGHSKHASGSRACFQYARDYMEAFGLPYALILGNHDLEGDEFTTDQDNLAAWEQVFGQPHYWAADLGHARLVGLSTTRYRSNENSHHEVYISDEQLAWLERQLQEHPDRPFIVLTHAPPMGCGLKVIQELHVKNRCAWLNHSANPRAFVDLVGRHPGRIKLWFSGHFHLSQNYPDSISTVGSTAFVQVGVIGECNRDGNRQSRLVRGDAHGYQLFSVDHDTGAVRLDLAAAWADPSAPVPVTPEDQLLCDPDAGWLCSQLDCKVGDNVDGYLTWFPVGDKTILALQAGGLLVEYDMSTAAPYGLVTRVPEDCAVQLVGADGLPASRDDGSDVAEVRIIEADGSLREALPRNSSGCFFRVYQPNKWRLKQQQKQQEAAAAAAAAAASEGSKVAVSA